MIDIPDSIFPTNAQGEAVCPKCLKLIKACDCPVFEVISKNKEPKLNPWIRIEKSGRSGKVVTVIERLPRDENFLKDLSKTLKARTGSGGTFYLGDESGVIELQGDKRTILTQFFQSK